MRDNRVDIVAEFLALSEIGCAVGFAPGRAHDGGPEIGEFGAGAGEARGAGHDSIEVRIQFG